MGKRLSARLAWISEDKCSFLRPVLVKYNEVLVAPTFSLAPTPNGGSILAGNCGASIKCHFFLDKSRASFFPHFVRRAKPQAVKHLATKTDRPLLAFPLPSATRLSEHPIRQQIVFKHPLDGPHFTFDNSRLFKRAVLFAHPA